MGLRQYSLRVLVVAVLIMGACLGCIVHRVFILPGQLREYGSAVECFAQDRHCEVEVSLIDERVSKIGIWKENSGGIRIIDFILLREISGFSLSSITIYEIRRNAVLDPAAKEDAAQIREGIVSDLVEFLNSKDLQHRFREPVTIE